MATVKTTQQKKHEQNSKTAKNYVISKSLLSDPCFFAVCRTLFPIMKQDLFMQVFSLFLIKLLNHIVVLILQ